MIALTSNNQLMLEKSADYLWVRQQTILDNIANAETPNYKVKTVSFEEEFDAQLRAAAGYGTRSENSTERKNSRARIADAIRNADWTVTEDGESTRLDDNGVNATEQMVEAVRNAYQLEYTYNAISKDFSIMSVAIGS